ncbi:TPR repeat protein Oca3/ER membrane protein complex Ecm2 [Schizosaccharomyces cryophilus OY26]|uniref:ER membrane protein complex subunit 2 n=1 Tax=Schizosaccharomyces cryophilus (strain OY26 / ATCC MYA-4695 / CBS 11777 / NBRC 106824 / NRRL Y48691) TaxID=653667 RepID=S9X6V3_SCHCR|nr:TPR repeat protein Oca3/ER membrane protein complex Ecm2 [Schizosaccharomyces cryophilus OY26]EPY49506.1 TPR repeat protein Oca3/ER membrane protein complex Ecm2 [Schizosaccharomyces cryophilus OY26]
MNMSANILEISEIKDPQKVLQVFEGQESTAKLDKYGDLVWDVYQKVFVAALILKEDTLAKKCWNRLNDRFNKSPRVDGLYGMYLEATSTFEDALDYYNQKLFEDSTNTIIHKRKLSLLRSVGKLKECINGLIEYVDTFYNDIEAWAELADLYFSVEAYEKSAFCYEEMLLLQPFEPRIFAKLADLHYVMSRSNPIHLWISLKHYCRAVEICEAYFHAWYGIRQCCEAINKMSKSELKRIQSRVSEETLKILADDSKVEGLLQLSGKMVSKFTSQDQKLQKLLSA